MGSDLTPIYHRAGALGDAETAVLVEDHAIFRGKHGLADIAEEIRDMSQLVTFAEPVSGSKCRKPAAVQLAFQVVDVTQIDGAFGGSHIGSCIGDCVERHIGSRREDRYNNRCGDTARS